MNADFDSSPEASAEQQGSVIRGRSDHPISRRDIDPDALSVLYRLHQRGFKGYLVGGGVRDLLLGRRPKDFDIGTDAHPNQIKSLFRNCFLIGRRFRLAHIRFGQKVIETSTFRRSPQRTENDADLDADLLQHRDNTFGSPEEDARRRDFTVNGIFYDIGTFSIIDHVGGLDDLDRRLIRCIGDPDIRFREDPVRMIRAVRFAARLGFTVEPSTYAAIRRHHAEIAKAAPPRMLEEIYRLFGYQTAQEAFQLLHETGLLAPLFPEIEEYLRHGREAREMLWGALAAIDRLEAEQGGVNEVLMFGSLFCGPFDRMYRAAVADGQRVVPYELAHRLVLPCARRYTMPKWLLYRLMRALGMLHRLEAPSDSVNARRVAAQESFPEALSLFRVWREGRGLDAGPVEHWQRMHEECSRQRRRTGHAETGRPEHGHPDAHGRAHAGRPHHAAPVSGRPRRSHSRRRRFGGEPGPAQGAQNPVR